jgi:hypothetical protein
MERNERRMIVPQKKGGMYNVLKLPNNRKQLVIISLAVMGASDVH